MYDYNCPECNESKLQSDKNARKINEVIDQVNALIQVNNETVNFIEEKANEVVGEIAEIKVNEVLGDIETSLDNMEYKISENKTVIIYPSDNAGNEIDNAMKDNSISTIILRGTFSLKANKEDSSCIYFASNKKLIFENGSRIILDSDNASYYRIINKQNVENVEIVNANVYGDNLTNSSNGEWGHGVSIEGSQNVYINSIIADSCFGDGVNISDNETHKSYNINIDKIMSDGCGRQAVTVYGGDNITLKEVHGKNITRTLPKAVIDIETNDENSIYGKINIGKVYADNCMYGVLFAPMGYGNLENPKPLNITIDEINTSENVEYSLFVDSIYSNNIKGIFNVNTINAYRTKTIFSGKNTSKELYFNVFNVTGIDVGKDNEIAPFIFDSSDTTIPSINNIKIYNIYSTINSSCPYSVYINNLTTELQGATQTCFCEFIRMDKEAYINGSFNPVKVKGIEISLKDWTQGWSTFHFKANKYTNKGATSTRNFAPYDLSLIGGEVEFEVVEPYRIEFRLQNQTGIIPSSLNFSSAYGIWSNEVGAKIKLKQENNKIVVVEKIGAWENL